MKWLVSFLILSVSAVIYSQDNILGVWLTSDGKSKIEIFKSGDQYDGKIVWVLDSIDPNTGKYWADVYNPDPSLRHRPVHDLVILDNFKYQPDKNIYSGGTLYFPRNGKSYRGKLWLKDENTLLMRGYVLLFYSTDEWKRVR